MTTQWQDRYAERTNRMKSSMIRELLKLTQNRELISFAGGMPAPDLFPHHEILEATQRVMGTQNREALQYGQTEGYLPLREMIARHMRRYGIVCTADNILITSGSQQALDLIGKVLIDPDDAVVVENPTYLGALQAWNTYGANYIPVKMDDQGMCAKTLEPMLREGDIKFIYALPNFQNPTGLSMSHQRRVELITLSNQYNVPIIEDDPYGQLRYEGNHETPLFVLDAALNKPDGNHLVNGNVIYLSTFSKTLCPGFRVAWMVAPEAVISRMVQAKQGTDLHTSTLTQMIAYETARGGFLDRHIRELRIVYRQRRDHMLALMEEHFPMGVRWTTPEGGLFLWVTLPHGMDSAHLLETAIQNKVAFVPGSAFYAQGGGQNTLRMNFSYANREQIEEGIKRLAAVIRCEMQAVSYA